MPYDIKRQVIQNLWNSYIGLIPKFNKVFSQQLPVLDHFAIIDINSKYSDKATFERVFNRLGFVKKGEGYLEEKINEFIWLSANEDAYLLPEDSLPQPIFADFKLELLTSQNKKIIDQYTKEMMVFDENLFYSLLNSDQNEAVKYLSHILNTRPWKKPSLKHYLSVKEENQLLAWVLLFGRKVNHFGVNINFLNEYKNLEDFHDQNRHYFEFNKEDGEIKGGKYCGIAQSSTVGQKVYVEVEDGTVEVRDSFLEFVWRFSDKENPKYFNDYYTGFIAKNANKVVESVYSKDPTFLDVEKAANYF
jgi:hypothetical protein